MNIYFLCTFPCLRSFHLKTLWQPLQFLVQNSAVPLCSPLEPTDLWKFFEKVKIIFLGARLPDSLCFPQSTLVVKSYVWIYFQQLLHLCDYSSYFAFYEWVFSLLSCCSIQDTFIYLSSLVWWYSLSKPLRSLQTLLLWKLIPFSFANLEEIFSLLKSDFHTKPDPDLCRNATE